MTDQVLERFWDKIEVQPNNCWYYEGHIKGSGYRGFWYKCKEVLAHRFAYEVNKGKIPKGLTIDHLCKNRNCVNPNHLEAVTMKENLLRGNTFQAKNSKKTHCPNGHIYSGKNKNGSRICHECHAMQQQDYLKKQVFQK